MRDRSIARPWGFAAALVLPIIWGATVDCQGAPAEKLPPFADVQRVVQAHFQAKPDYKPGDIIARGDIKPVFSALAQIGFEVADAKAILESVPADNDFLVTSLRSAAGRRFMQQVARYPMSYDRLDRLGRLPHGRQTVRDLIKGPDGYKMIDYMTTAHGGREMGKMLSKAPKGKDFNAPTGRIYTVDQLLKRLKQSYDKAARQPLSATGGPT